MYAGAPPHRCRPRACWSDHPTARLASHAPPPAATLPPALPVPPGRVRVPPDAAHALQVLQVRDVGLGCGSGLGPVCAGRGRRCPGGLAAPHAPCTMHPRGLLLVPCSCSHCLGSRPPTAQQHPGGRDARGPAVRRHPQLHGGRRLPLINKGEDSLLAWTACRLHCSRRLPLVRTRRPSPARPAGSPLQAADIVRILGIGRNEYIATMVQVRQQR